MRAVWDMSTPPPTKESPQLAVILVPRAGSVSVAGGGGGLVATPSTSAKDGWVFPVDKPLAPEEGDNQALAVNTRDNSMVYDAALAMVYVEGSEAMNVNEAHAYASCDSCGAVAVAYQVVIVLDTDPTDDNVAVAAEPGRRPQLRLRQLHDLCARAAAVHHDRRTADRRAEVGTPKDHVGDEALRSPDQVGHRGSGGDPGQTRRIHTSGYWTSSSPTSHLTPTQPSTRTAHRRAERVDSALVVRAIGDCYRTTLAEQRAHRIDGTDCVR